MRFEVRKGEPPLSVGPLRTSGGLKAKERRRDGEARVQSRERAGGLATAAGLQGGGQVAAGSSAVGTLPEQVRGGFPGRRQKM